MSSPEAPLIKVRAYEKFDGSLWRQFESADSLIILTAAGRRLLAGQRLSPLLHSYVEDYQQGKAGESGTRRFLVAGTSAHVFSLNGAEMVVKEAKPGRDQLWPALDRMDRLVDAVEKHCPHWIGIPRHYGLLVPKKNIQDQFLLMQKINSGVTVGDILDVGRQGAMPERHELRQAAAHTFGPINPEFKAEVSDRFQLLGTELRGALMHEHLSPDKYLPDLDHNPYNVIVERADPPVAGSHLKFWVIDQ